jgi:hypothetical protein
MSFAVISYLYVVFFLIAWLVDLLPLFSIVKNSSLVSRQSMQTIKSNDIDDSEKEKMLLNNSFKLFKQSLKLFAFIVLIAACGFALLLISPVIKPLNYAKLIKYVPTLYCLVLSILSFVSYFLLKKLYVKIRLQQSR